MTYNFKDHKKGDSFIGVSFIVTINESPLNLTGASIRMALKINKSARLVAKLFTTTDNSIAITEPLNGRFNI